MKGKLEKIYSILFAVFCFAIPFSQFGEAIPNIALTPLIGLFPFVITKNELKKCLKVPLYIILSLLLVILVETLVFMRWEDLKFFTKFLIIPVIFLLAIPVKNKRFSFLGFLAGASFLMVSAYLRILGYYFQNDGFEFSAGKFINEILMGDRPYVGFVYVISILLCVYFFINTKKKVYKVILSFSGFLFFALILIISARLSLLSLICLMVLSFFYTKKWKLSAILVLGLGLSVFLMFVFNQNFIDRFYSGFKQEKYTIENALIMEPRYHIWDCAIDLVKEEKTAFWKGIGVQWTTDYLVDCFHSHENFKSAEHRQYFIKSRFNTHNQFLGIYLSSGFFALFLLFSFFGISFFQTRKNYFAFASILALFLFCLVENVLSRQMGCMLFGFVWVFASSFTQNANSSSSAKNLFQFINSKIIKFIK